MTTGARRPWPLGRIRCPDVYLCIGDQHLSGFTSEHDRHWMDRTPGGRGEISCCPCETSAKTFRDRWRCADAGPGKPFSFRAKGWDKGESLSLRSPESQQNAYLSPAPTS